MDEPEVDAFAFLAALMVFCKYPEPGEVKTRLAEAIGAEAAADWYRSSVENTLRAVRPLADRMELTVCFDPPEAAAAVRDWLGGGYLYAPQRGPDLGARMLHAFEEARERGHDRMVIIGTDCPALGMDQVVDAYGLLGRYDVVLGPARDGGYYLIGLRRPIPALFENIPWSTGGVLARTREIVEQEGLDAYELEPLTAVDTFDDLDAAERELAGS